MIVYRIKEPVVLYTLARNASTRFASAPARRADRNIPLTRPGVLSEQVEAMRSGTRGYQKIAVKDRFRELREQLAPEDQLWLVLRIDRDMSWRDLALTLSGDVDMTDELITNRRVSEKPSNVLKVI